KDIPSAAELEPNSIVFISFQYPSYVIRYMVGGVIIGFHSVFLIMITLRLIWAQTYSINLVLWFIAPMVISYALKSSFTRWIGTFFTFRRHNDGFDVLNVTVSGISVLFNIIAGKCKSIK